MQRCSNTIGSIASAIAKAQTELTNPEKSLTAVIQSPFPREGTKSFRYASLASGLDVVRKVLGKNDVAVIQSTTIDWDARLIRLTTTLAHSSGEWLASDWPVCAVGEAETPHKLGTALTYARRYGLFTLVGIAGEDDLDAPDLLSAASAKSTAPSNNGNVGPINLGFDSLNHPSVVTKSQSMARKAKVALRPPIFGPTESGVSRDKLLDELAHISAERLTDWARTTLPTKNRLQPVDADVISDAFSLRIASIDSAESQGQPSQSATGSCIAASQSKIDKSALMLGEPRRLRDKAHLKLVSAQSCLVCGRQPCDPHHLKFAQPRAMARKVSDEFVVPLCRVHHRELHHRGDERMWWAEQGIEPLPIAAALWAKSRGTSHTSAQDTVNSVADTHRNRRRRASVAQVET